MKINVHSIKQGLILFFFCLNISMLGQKAPEKFGEINKSALQITTCPIDSNANAYFIFDFGTLYFDRFHNIHYTRHYKIKILDIAESDWADISVFSRGIDNLETIEAITYNYENGEIIKTRLTKADVKKENITQNYFNYKLALKDVKAGSIIEVRFKTKIEEIYHLPTWRFQHSIPVLLSEFHTYVDDRFTYRQTIPGTHPIKTEKEESYSNEGFKDKITHFYAKNIPAINKEPYLKLLDNYITKVESELVSYEGNINKYNNLSTTWDHVTLKLSNSDFFTSALSQKAYLKEDLKEIKASKLEGLDLLNYSFDFYKTRIKWNKKETKYINTSLRSAYKNGEGNSADINFGLINLLRQLDFEVYPLILSTQDNGFIYTFRPTISGFNYVIALVKLDGLNYLLDATSLWSEPNLLPIRCLNGFGRVIDKKLDEWINLDAINYFKRQSFHQLKLNEDFNFKGKIKYISSDYAAYSKRTQINNYSNHNDYIKDLEENREGLIIDDFKIINDKKTNSTLTESFQVTIENHVEEAGDLVLISPLFYETRKENPFKQKTRSYPVEYNYPFHYDDTYILTIPEGFEVESIPETINIELPDNSARYIFQVLSQNNLIKVRSLFQINKVTFQPTDYKALRKFYDQVTSKQNEKIVLKVIENEAL